VGGGTQPDCVGWESVGFGVDRVHGVVRLNELVL